MKARNEVKKLVDTTARIRVPMGAKRNVLSVQNTPDGYVDRIVNDVPGRIERFKQAGYEMVDDAKLGTSHVDGNQSYAGAVSRNVGKNLTGYVMRQREDWYKSDQAAKQQRILDDENAMRRKKVNPHESKDGSYGEVKIG